jgi:hypothetical protein
VILANYTQENRNTYRVWGPAFSNPLGGYRAPVLLAFYIPNTAQSGRDLSAFPHGYHTHHAWSLPLKTGGIASTLNIRGTGTLAANALAVKLAEAALSGSGDLAATGGLIVQAIAALTGSGAVSSADVGAFLAAVAALTGTGGISSSDLAALGALIAALTGSGTSGASTLSAIGELGADLTVTGTGLSTANVGEAVWSALAASNNAADTMGELINNLGAGADPWTVTLDGSYTAADLLRVMASAMAGKLSGVGTGEIIFRDVNDTKDRITATVDGSGNRTAITLDEGA